MFSSFHAQPLAHNLLLRRLVVTMLHSHYQTTLVYVQHSRSFLG